MFEDRGIKFNFCITGIMVLLFFLTSCAKLRELDQEIEIEPLMHGLKTSATIGYCASLASSAFRGEELPENTLFQSYNSDIHSGYGILIVDINENNPLPFHNQIGQIVIAGIWDEDFDGVISILLTDIDLLSGKFQFYGIHTVPVLSQKENDRILTLVAQQDIIIGEGSDTLLNIGLTKIQFDAELERLNNEQPSDVFVAVQQNVWFVNIDQRGTPSDIYDDLYIMNGGGQILEGNSESGGILYHAMIQTLYDQQSCFLNPIQGIALIQNLKAGSFIDLGNALLDFHDACDGRVHVSFASGKYITSNGRDILLQ